MGEIYRARDLEQERAVAIKVLRDAYGADEARFQREARLLEGLAHPGVVRYVAHGALPLGTPYIAMEWLEGEDLSRRLSRGRLGIEASVQVARAVAEALGAAHASGIVHRDLKPSNVFLVEGSPEQVKLLDFGVAWPGLGTRITNSGAVVGTPGYMAPEQARNVGVVDARADIFALGCVLFECLAGERPFQGDHLVAVLAKILFDDPPRLRDLRSEVPEALALLCDRMLSKDPARRPQHGSEAARELDAIALGDITKTGTPTPSARLAALTTTERRTAAVLLIGVASGAPPEPELAEATTAPDAATLPGALFREAASRGAHVESLQGGATVLTMVGRSAATDLATQAAGTALGLREMLPDRPMALALGWSATTGRTPLRDAIDRAAALLSAKAPGDARSIALDDGFAGLLSARFELCEHDDRFFLVGERDITEGGRTLLGKQTSCVGRDAELRSMDAEFESCVEEPTARVVLVTAPPGVGKSRLGQELLRRARARAPHASIWMGAGDPLRARSPLGLLAQAIKGAFGILEGEPLAARHDKLRARVARRAPEAERRRITEFVGELVGAPFPDEESPPLRAARRDAQVMHEQMSRAFVELVRSACAEAPVIVLLEDLHWGDLATTTFINAALRELADEPLFVLALARPEIYDMFPGLWAERGVHELRLRELGRKGCERLVRQVLGEGAETGTIERIVALSDGNAFYLEELIRAASEGRKGELPRTVVAMVQSRLGTLDGEARRLLRAASVFGETCWASGVAALVGGPTRAGLATLVEQELLVKRRESRYAGEDELGFRHALLREGAYAMLTEEDLVLGHRLAGEWLEAHGESDPLVLAGHFDKAGEHTLAARHWLQAAESAHRADDVDEALALVEKGLAGPLPTDLELAYLGLRCELGSWRLDTTGSTMSIADRLLREAPPGSVPRVRGMSTRLIYAYLLGKFDEFEATLDGLANEEPTAETIAYVGFAQFVGLHGTMQRGYVADRAAFLARARATLDEWGAREPYVAAFLSVGFGTFHLVVREEPWRALELVDAGYASYLLAEHARGAAGTVFVRGLVLWALGATKRAEEELTAVAGADELHGGWCSYRPFVLAHIAMERGEHERARRIAEGLIASGRARRITLDEGRGHWLLAEALLRIGHLEEAEREIDAALALVAESGRTDVPAVFSTLAAIHLAAGDAAKALAAAEEGMTRHAAVGGCGFLGGPRLRLLHAESLMAAGRREEAEKAIASARDRLLGIAEGIADAEYRKSFLEHVQENRRTLELAAEWLGREATRGPIAVV